MRVGVDATSWTNRRGYGRFARNALRRLIELDGESSYVFYIDAESAAEAQLPSAAEVREVALSAPASRSATAGSNRSPFDLLRLVAAVRRDRLEAFLFPSIYTYFPVLRTPTIVGVHDVIADEYPELTLPSFRARLLWRAKESLALRRATRLFTVSKASRAAIAARLRIDPERFAIVPEAPDPVFSPRDDTQIAKALDGLSLPRDRRYLLFTGGISPHKNIETLLEAYARLARDASDRPVLVLVGDLDSDPYHSAASAVHDRIATLGLGPSVVLPGFVQDEELACLYSGAAAVVLPSLSEGFGLPAVEAAACGAPVLLSDIPAHRETLGEAAIYFPASDAGALAVSIERVLADASLSRSLAERGRSAVAALSWDASAARLRDLLVETAAA